MTKSIATSSYLVILLALIAGGCASQQAAPTSNDRPATFWPPYPDEPRVQFLTAYTFTYDIQSKKTKLDEIIYGKGNDQGVEIQKPYGVRMINGSIYVCDTQTPGVLVLDLKKHETRVIGASGAGVVGKAVDIAVAPDGFKYVADTSRPAIYVFDAQDKFVRYMGSKESRLVGVAVRGNELLATDYKNHVIVVFNRFTGQQLRTIGEPGKELGQLGGPLGIAIDAKGNIFVTEILNCRVQKLNPDGTPATKFGVRGDRPGTFTRPKHVTVDADGLIYVVDAAFQNVQILDNNLNPLTFFGGHGNFRGYMDLPAGVATADAEVALYKDLVHPAFDAKRLILVTNQWGENRVSVYALGQLKPGKTVADISSGRSGVSAEAFGLNKTTQPSGVGEVDPKAVPKDLKEHP